MTRPSKPTIPPALRVTDRTDAIDDTPATVLVSLHHRVEALESAAVRQGRFVQWLIVIILGIGTSIAGVAYSAHSQLADRLIEVTRLTEAQLARIEERMAAQQQLLEHVFKQRP